MSYNSLKNRYIVMRPVLDRASVYGNGIPEIKELGVYKGFGLAIWNDNREELFYRLLVPNRWDGVTAPIVRTHIWLTGIETVGKKCNLQLGYSSTGEGENVISETPTLLEGEITVVEGRTAIGSIYHVDMTLNPALLKCGDVMGGRIRRIACSGSEFAKKCSVVYTEVISHLIKYTVNWYDA